MLKISNMMTLQLHLVFTKLPCPGDSEGSLAVKLLTLFTTHTVDFTLALLVAEHFHNSFYRRKIKSLV